MLSVILHSYIHTEIIFSLIAAEFVYLFLVFGLKNKFSIDSVTDYKNSLFFLAGIFVLFLALVWPLHYISEYYLFSAHMLQHVMISYIAPPLILSGVNHKILDSFLGLKYVRNSFKFFLHPIFCFVFFNVIFGLWHLPNIYDLSVSFEQFHALEHSMFITGAIFMWWPLVNQSKILHKNDFEISKNYISHFHHPTTSGTRQSTT